jgi:thiamine-phosphate pyrophosphorylase
MPAEGVQEKSKPLCPDDFRHKGFCIRGQIDMYGKRQIKDYSLYLVLTEEYGAGRPLLQIAELALAGGVNVLQMREKQKSRAELLCLGSNLAALCRSKRATFIVNDDPLLAVELEADGVHMGQEDLQQCPVDEVRRIIGNDLILGISTHSLEQFRQANELDADYLAFGPIFPTRTKDYFIGTREIREVVRIAAKPVVFIGGINTANLEVLLNEGATNVALIRDIMQADDVVSRAGWYKEQLIRRKGSAK